MTTTANPVPGQRQELKSDVFLRGPGYALTAREVVDVIANYLAKFGDQIGPDQVTAADAIHAEMVYGGSELDLWTQGRTPDQVAVIRARAEQIARAGFRRFPTVTW